MFISFIKIYSKATKRRELVDKNKLLGCIFGGAIGDALGYPIEFHRGIKSKTITRYPDDKGIISDDTQMTLFTANGLLWRETRLINKGIAPDIVDALYLAYLDWLETQDKYKVNQNRVTWLKYIPELKVQRAPGQTCLAALASGQKGTISKPINDSKGCGGLMRLAPVGLCARSPELAGEYGARCSAITHGHIYSTLASFVFGAIINILTNTQDSIKGAITSSISLLQDFCKQYKLCSKKVLADFVTIINSAISLSEQEGSDINAIKKLGEGWVAEEALAIAIYSCLKHSDSFEEAIVCAVNHDGDSDSTGAVAGNILGAYVGYEAIPEKWKTGLQMHETILEIAEDLCTSEAERTDAWQKKYGKQMVS